MIHTVSKKLKLRHVVGLVYLASPKPTFGTQWASFMLGRARRLFPHGAVIAAGTLFVSDEDWLKRWPFVLPSLAALAFFSEPDGTLGMGVCKEITDAQALGLPVVLVTERGRALTPDRFELVPHEVRSPRRFARVVTG